MRRHISEGDIQHAIAHVVQLGQEPNADNVCKLLGIPNAKSNHQVLHEILDWQAKHPKKNLPSDNKIQELKNTLTLLKGTLNSTADGILMISTEGQLLNWNQKFIDMFHLPTSALESKIEGETRKYLCNQIEDSEAFCHFIMKPWDSRQEKPPYGEFRFKDGRTIACYAQAYRAGSTIVGQVWSFRDITEQHKIEEMLRLRELAIESSPHGAVITEATFPYKIVYVNSALQRITGLSKKELINQKFEILFDSSPDQPSAMTIALALKNKQEEQAIISFTKKDGRLIWYTLHVSPVLDEHNKVTHFVGALVDITERKALEDQLIHQATHDALTELPNNSLLIDRLQQAIFTAKRENGLVSLLYIDLDHFKEINESMGHSIGDQVLISVAKRLKNCVRETDTVARLGGDEFLIVRSIKKPEHIILFAQRILRTISEPLKINDTTIHTTASIGISIYPIDGQDIESLIKNADLAIYHAKEQGRNNFTFYTERLNQKLLQRIALEKDLRRAIQEEQFQLHYQPIIDLKNGKIIGNEALLRWMHPKKGMVPPLDFIPFTEESGLIVPLGKWIIKNACQQNQLWHKKSKCKLKIAINISAIQLRDPNFFNTLTHIIEATKIKPEDIELELTESILMDKAEIYSLLLSKINELGISLVIDDFGTGYSSLSYLRRFPIKKIKIDRSFVNDIDKNNESNVIIQTIIAMGKNLNLEVVAEGVETKEQLMFLLKSGCDQAQGFYFQKPLEKDALTKIILKSHRFW